MTTPPELLEQALGAHGDTLYRMALLLAGDERRAAELLRAAVGDLLAAAVVGPIEEAELLAHLATAARRAETKTEGRRPAPRPPADLPPLYRSALGLPLAQRLALGLYLLAGYDLARSARAAGVDEPGARSALIDAVRSLAPGAGQSLTDRVSGDLCPDVRAALIDPSGRARHSSVARGHLATCAACRSFDHSWVDVCQAIEGALRGALRERGLPTELAAKLGALARPPQRRLSPNLRFALPPLAVLALVAALVLPGFGRQPVTLVDRDETPPSDPQTLIAEALARHSLPPDDGQPVWHGRFETLWYFDDDTVAPLHADLWLDRGNPARHRLQIAHSAGGAPYELQVGTGRDLLYYALDAAYAPALYGNIAVSVSAERPLLLAMAADREAQRRALSERLGSGPWGIPPAYLRQAAAAGDLRVLGRQRDGRRTVQIISFSGFSPLGLPPDAPGATAERVTVLLALDSADGRLRSATELVGPPGGTQVSRVTWRLIEEQGLATNQIDAAFSIDRAWNGVGDFAERARHTPADPAALVFTRAILGNPARSLSNWPLAPWMPGAPPPGVERAALIWPEQLFRSGERPQGLIYSGPGRRLAIDYHLSRPVVGEQLEQIGPWSVRLIPGRGNSYSVQMEREPGRAPGRQGFADATTRVRMLARGFTGAELRAVIAGFRPVDVASVAAQDALFAQPDEHAPAARAALLALVGAEVSDQRIVYTRAEQYTRQNERLPNPPDPYHRPPYDGQPARTIVESWRDSRAGLTAVYARVSDPADGTIYKGVYLDATSAWDYYAPGRGLNRWGGDPGPLLGYLPQDVQLALRMLNDPGGTLSVEPRPGGGQIVRRREDPHQNPEYQWMLSTENGEPYLADSAVIALTSELEIDAAGATAAYQLIAELAPQGGRSSPQLLARSYVVRERRAVAPAAAPPELGGALPPAAYTRDWRSFESDQPRSNNLATLTLSQTLELAAGPLYLLPAAGSSLVRVEGGVPGELFLNAEFEDITAEAVGQGLAYRFVYQYPPERAGRRATELRITQGPTEPLRALFASSYALPWFEAVPGSLEIGGVARPIWVARGREQGYVFVELGATLLVAEAPIGWFDQNLPAALAVLEQVK